MTAETGRVWVIAAHPDDPEFLTGGTIARLAREGREIAYVIVTNGKVHAALGGACVNSCTD